MGRKLQATFHGERHARDLFFALFDLPETATSIDVQTMADTMGFSVRELAALFKRYGCLTFEAEVEPESPLTAARTALMSHYKVTVTQVDSQRRRSRTTKNDRLKLQKMKPGEHHIRYRVEIVTSNKVVATTDFSPASSFHITHS